MEMWTPVFCREVGGVHGSRPQLYRAPFIKGYAWVLSCHLYTIQFMPTWNHYDRDLHLLDPRHQRTSEQGGFHVNMVELCEPPPSPTPRDNNEAPRPRARSRQVETGIAPGMVWLRNQVSAWSKSPRTLLLSDPLLTWCSNQHNNAAFQGGQHYRTTSGQLLWVLASALREAGVVTHFSVACHCHCWSPQLSFRGRTCGAEKRNGQCWRFVGPCQLRSRGDQAHAVCGLGQAPFTEERAELLHKALCVDEQPLECRPMQDMTGPQRTGLPFTGVLLSTTATGST